MSHLPYKCIIQPTSKDKLHLQMNTLIDKNIIVAVTGGIAAYKSAEIVRQFKRVNAHIRVIMTPGSKEFIRPLTLQALSGNPVYSELLDEEAEMGMSHIELAKWADLILVAPASADFIADFTHGKADNLLGAVLLATSAKVVICPAMNSSMWLHHATKANVETLLKRDIKIIGPDIGIQACGDTGPGRMSEPTDIFKQCAQCFNAKIFEGIKIIITAGPTREWLDPIRFISNQSSGKMGYAIAQAAVDAGAEVLLVSGPVDLIPPKKVQFHSAMTAQGMLDLVLEHIANAHIFISTAAVADYAPINIAKNKIKSDTKTISISLNKNKDIVKTVATEYPNVYVVGFAAETNNISDYARSKLVSKKLNAIIVNDVSRSDIGFNSDDNEVTWIDKETELEIPKMSKTQLAHKLIELINQKIKN